MKEKLKLLIAAVRRQLDKMNQSASELHSYLNSGIDLENPDNAQKGAIGYYLHNLYNGAENIFFLIAKTFENNIDPDQGHRSMLTQMSLEIQDIRPRVIDEELATLLDDFRGFRHVFRHTYSFELDWSREKLVVDKLPRTIKLFNDQLEGFIEKLEKSA